MNAQSLSDVFSIPKAPYSTKCNGRSSSVVVVGGRGSRQLSALPNKHQIQAGAVQGHK
jgi:hypothetical protein